MLLRHPAMGDVADQADGQSLNLALDPANGEDVEQTLRRVFVGAVAGINDAAIQVIGQQVRRSGHRVANDHDVHTHRFDVLGRVDEGFPLANAGSATGEVNRVGTEAPGREAETGAGARGRLEEQIDDHLALQVGAFLALALADFDEFFRSVEHFFYVHAAQVF